MTPMKNHVLAILTRAVIPMYTKTVITITVLTIQNAAKLVVPSAMVMITATRRIIIIMTMLMITTTMRITIIMIISSSMLISISTEAQLVLQEASTVILLKSTQGEIHMFKEIFTTMLIVQIWKSICLQKIALLNRKNYHLTKKWCKNTTTTTTTTAAASSLV